MDKQALVFSEIKGTGIHMAIVTADESRSGSRDIYIPPHENGMAHRSYPSPDRKQLLLVEMDGGPFIPCRVVLWTAVQPGDRWARPPPAPDAPSPHGHR